MPLALNSSSSRQNYELFTTIPEPAFSKQFHQKLFFYCINSKALLICTFWRWKSLLGDPSPSFSAFLSCFLSHTHSHYTNKRQPVSIPLVWERVTEVRLAGPDCSQTPWLSSVSLRLTPCQREVTEQTTRPPSSSSEDLLSPLFLQ